MGVDTALIWAMIIAFGVMLYVIADGFDLGIGILFAVVKDQEHRGRMIHSIAPVWDGNETWLVMGGAGLMAAFPIAYSAILSALYIPIILMLLGLILRGVAFEARLKSRIKSRHLWDKALFGGSFMAAFSQGVILGTYISGIQMQNKVFSGGPMDWISPFSLFCGLALVVTYTLLGATWLIMKTEGQLQSSLRALARPLVLLMALFIAGVSIWTPLAHGDIATRWFSVPNIFWLVPLPVLTACTCAYLYQSLAKGEFMPFVMTLCTIALGYLGLLISLWPNVIPHEITIWEASSPASSQGFTLVGTLLILPLILVYSAWSYYVFRGKVQDHESYY